MGEHRIRGEVLSWLNEAREDIEVAGELIGLGRYSHACFMAQQAAEKALKALILARLRVYERIHDLTELYSSLEGHLTLPDEVEDKLPTLSAYYVTARYPNAGLRQPSRSLGRTQAEEALRIAEVVVEAVERIIGEA